MVDSVNSITHPTTASFEANPGLRRRVLTKDEVIAYALASLGFPNIKIEATDDQFGILIQKLLDEYNCWRPVEKFDVLDNTTSVINKYNLRELNKPYGRGIVHVSIGTKENFFSPISGVFALGIPHPISHLSPDQYDLALRYIKMAKKVYSSEPDWEFEEPILWLYAPTGYGGPFVAAYTYYADCTGVEDIREYDYSWAKEYFMNLVKRAVGHARRKYGSIPGPQGTNLDGTELVKEAEDELKRLSSILESKSYSDAPPISPGGLMG
jgi:hypothetical protein